jgi:hypothetical protein
MIKIDPDDVTTQAQVLVGRFLYHWGTMEFEVNRAIGKVLKLDAAQTWIVARNMQLRDKLNVLRTVTNLEGPTADGTLIIKALDDIATLANNSRNLIAHESFYPSRDGAGVEFFRVQARDKFAMPNTVWTPGMFEEKFASLQAIAAVLRGKFVPPKNALALVNRLAAAMAPAPTAGLVGLTAPHPPGHRIPGLHNYQPATPQTDSETSEAAPPSNPPKEDE